MNTFYLLMIPIGIVVIIIAARIASLISSIAPFSYPNARIMAKTGKLLTAAKFEELSESSSIDDVINQLKETEYEDYISKYVGGDYTISDVERALNNHLADIYTQINDISPASVKPVFEVLLKRWDIENIIRTLRCIYAHKDPKDYILNIGTFSNAQREHLAKSVTVDEVTLSVSKEFEHILNNVQDQDFVVIENTLLGYYYESLWKFLDSSRDSNILLLREYFGMDIDITNILAALRMNAFVEIENVSSHLLPVTYHVSFEDLKSMASAEEMNIVLNILSKTPYSKIFEENMAEYEKNHNLSVFERSLRNMAVNKGKEVAILNSLGIGPAIGYLAQKQQEVQRLRVILIGIYEGIDSEKIKNIAGVA